MGKEILKRNWFWIILIMGLLFVFSTRFSYLPTSIVSNTDSSLLITTQDVVLEQTWQPMVKRISAIELPYYVQDSFNCDINLKVYNDDYSEVLIDLSKSNYEFIGETSGSIEFTFDSVKVIPGERYRIQYNISELSKNAELEIITSSNYGGCSVNGEETEKAIALTIILVKYSKIFWVVAVLFPFFSGALLFMVTMGRKFEETVALAMFIEGIILFGFGMAEQLLMGLNVVYLLASVSMIVSVYLYNKKGLELKSLVSTGLIIYIIVFLLIVIGSRGEWLGSRDDLRHWGAAVNDMFYYDSLAKHVDSTVILQRYLPFASLIEYVFVYMNGLYSEDILLIAYQTMMLTVGIIICRKLEGKDTIARYFPIIVGLICIPVIFFENITGIVTVDSLQALIMAYVLISFYSEGLSGFNKWKIICALVVLTSLKDIGLVFSGMMAFIMFGDIVITQFIEKKFELKKILYPIICVAIVLCTYFGWQIYMSIPAEEKVAEVVQEIVIEENVEEQQAVLTGIQASGISLEGIVNVLSGDGVDYQYETTRRYFVELFDGDTYAFGTIKMSFGDILMIIVALILVLGYCGYWKQNKVRMYILATFLVFAAMILCAFLLITYWFSFERVLALELACFDRYLAPYLCATSIFIIYYISKIMCEEHNGEKNIYLLTGILSFLLLISMPMERIIVEINDVEKNATEENVYGYDTIAEILRSVAKRGEKVQFICSESDGYSEYLFRNAVCPLISNHSWWDIVATREIYDEQCEKYVEETGLDYLAQLVTVDMFEERLKENQYLVLFNVDEGFVESYYELFEDIEDIQDGSIFRVSNEQGELELQLIGQTGIKSWR